MSQLIKDISIYQQTKPIYDVLKTSKNKISYKHKHERDIILHEAAVRELRKHAGVGGKLPNL